MTKSKVDGVTVAITFSFSKIWLPIEKDNKTLKNSSACQSENSFLRNGNLFINMVSFGVKL